MQYLGLLPTPMGPRMATVRYFFTDALPVFPGWLRPPHSWANPWWDRIAHLNTRWQPGKPPVWVNGALPTPPPDCSCDCVPMGPPCDPRLGCLPDPLPVQGFTRSPFNVQQSFDVSWAWDMHQQKYIGSAVGATEFSFNMPTWQHPSGGFHVGILANGLYVGTMDVTTWVDARHAYFGSGVYPGSFGAWTIAVGIPRYFG